MLKIDDTKIIFNSSSNPKLMSTNIPLGKILIFPPWQLNILLNILAISPLQESKIFSLINFFDSGKLQWSPAPSPWLEGTGGAWVPPAESQSLHYPPGPQQSHNMRASLSREGRTRHEMCTSVDIILCSLKTEYLRLGLKSTNHE